MRNGCSPTSPLTVVRDGYLPKRTLYRVRQMYVLSQTILLEDVTGLLVRITVFELSLFVVNSRFLMRQITKQNRKIYFT